MRRLHTSILLSFFFFFLTASLSLAQSKEIASSAGGVTEASASSTDKDATSNKGDVSTSKPPTAPPSAFESTVRRWFEVQAASIGVRYRVIDNSAGVLTTNQLQHQEAFKGRFKFDPEGNFSLNVGVFSGSTFTGSWNNTGWGTGDGVSNLYLKQIYLSAKPVKGVEVQYGGLYVSRGESTEITTYDNDAYLVGERVVVKRPKEVFFDEISVTYAYLGDLNLPNFFKRYDRLSQSNYHQFLVSKTIGKRAVISGDYTFVSGVETMREAVKLNVKESRVVDSIRFENYQRMDVKPDYGFAISAERAFAKRYTVGGGYADIDPYYGGLNADRFNKGRRLFASGSISLGADFTMSAFVTRAVANDFTVANRTRFDLILTYNLLKGLQRMGIF